MCDLSEVKTGDRVVKLVRMLDSEIASIQTVAKVSGILVLALAAGVAVLFVVTRRRV